VNDGEVEVADEQNEEDVHQAVVDEDRAGKPEAGVALAVPEQESGEREQEGERGADRGVQLLAGVEEALWRPPAA